MLKLRQHSNGHHPKPQWESDNDADTALADKLASEPPTPVPAPVAPPKKAATPKPTVTAQQLLDMLVTAVLEERLHVIEQDGVAYLTELTQTKNTVTLRTLGRLGLGGTTTIQGSTVTK